MSPLVESVTTMSTDTKSNQRQKRVQRRRTIPSMAPSGSHSPHHGYGKSPVSSPTTSSSSMASPSGLQAGDTESPRFRTRIDPYPRYALRKRLSADFSDYTYSGDSGGESPKNEWRLRSVVNGPFLTGPLSNDYSHTSALDDFFKSPRSMMKKSIADVEKASGLLFPVIPDYVPPAITPTVFNAQQSSPAQEPQPWYDNHSEQMPYTESTVTPYSDQLTTIPNVIHAPPKSPPQESQRWYDNHTEQMPYNTESYSDEPAIVPNVFNAPATSPPQESQQWYDNHTEQMTYNTESTIAPYSNQPIVSPTVAHGQPISPPQEAKSWYDKPMPSLEPTVTAHCDQPRYPANETIPTNSTQEPPPTSNWYDQAYPTQTVEDKPAAPSSPIRQLRALTPTHSSNTSHHSTASTSAMVVPAHKSPLKSQITPSHSPLKPTSAPAPPTQQAAEPRMKSHSASETQEAFDRLSDGIAESVERILATTKDGKTHAEIELSCLIQKIQTHLKIMGRVSGSIKEAYDRTQAQLQQAEAEKRALEANNTQLQRVIDQFEGERMQFHQQLKHAQDLHDTMLKETVQHLTDQIKTLTETNAASTAQLQDQMTTTSSAVVAATTEAVAAASNAADECSSIALSAELVKQVDEIRDVLDHLVEQTHRTPSAPSSPTKKSRASSPSRPPSRRASYHQERRPSWKSLALSGFVVGAASLCGVYVGVNQGRSVSVTPETPSVSSTRLQESDLAMIVDRLTQSLAVHSVANTGPVDKAIPTYSETHKDSNKADNRLPSADASTGSNKKVIEMLVNPLTEEVVAKSLKVVDARFENIVIQSTSKSVASPNKEGWTMENEKTVSVEDVAISTEVEVPVDVVPKSESTFIEGVVMPTEVEVDDDPQLIYASAAIPQQSTLSDIAETSVEATVSASPMDAGIKSVGDKSNLEFGSTRVETPDLGVDAVDVLVESSTLESFEPVKLAHEVDIEKVSALVDDSTVRSNEIASVSMGDTEKQKLVSRADTCKPWAKAMHVWCPSLFDIMGEEEFPAPPTRDASPLVGLARALTSLSEYVASSEDTQLEVPAVKEHQLMDGEYRDDVADEIAVSRKSMNTEETSIVSVDTLEKIDMIDPLVSQTKQEIEEYKNDQSTDEFIPKQTDQLEDTTSSSKNKEQIDWPMCESNTSIVLEQAVKVVKDSVSNNWRLDMNTGLNVETVGDLAETVDTVTTPEMQQSVIIELPDNVENSKPSSYTNDTGAAIETIVEQVNLVESNGYDANSLVFEQNENVAMGPLETEINRVSSNTDSQLGIDQTLIGPGVKSGIDVPIIPADVPANSKPSVPVVPLVDVEGYAPQKLSLDVSQAHINVTKTREVDIAEDQSIVVETEQGAPVIEEQILTKSPLNSHETNVQRIESIAVDTVENVPTQIDELPGGMNYMVDTEVVVSSTSERKDKLVQIKTSKPAEIGTSSKSEHFLSYITTQAEASTRR